MWRDRARRQASASAGAGAPGGKESRASRITRRGRIETPSSRSRRKVSPRTAGGIWRATSRTSAGADGSSQSSRAWTSCTPTRRCAETADRRVRLREGAARGIEDFAQGPGAVRIGDCDEGGADAGERVAARRGRETSQAKLVGRHEAERPVEGDHAAGRLGALDDDAPCAGPERGRDHRDARRSARPSFATTPPSAPRRPPAAPEPVGRRAEQFRRELHQHTGRRALAPCGPPDAGPGRLGAPRRGPLHPATPRIAASERNGAAGSPGARPRAARRPPTRGGRGARRRARGRGGSATLRSSLTVRVTEMPGGDGQQERRDLEARPSPTASSTYRRAAAPRRHPALEPGGETPDRVHERDGDARPPRPPSRTGARRPWRREAGSPARARAAAVRPRRRRWRPPGARRRWPSACRAARRA